MKDSIAFLVNVSNSPELREQLSHDSADLIAVAAAAGISVDKGDLEAFAALDSLISSSSDELKKFFSLLAFDTAFMQQLNKPGCDPVLLAAEKGIIINQLELDSLTSAIEGNFQVELSDEELEQVTGGVFLEALAGAFVAPVIVAINITVGALAVAGAAAIGLGAYAIYKASK